MAPLFLSEVVLLIQLMTTWLQMAGDKIPRKEKMTNWSLLRPARV